MGDEFEFESHYQGQEGEAERLREIIYLVGLAVQKIRAPAERLGAECPSYHLTSTPEEAQIEMWGRERKLTLFVRREGVDCLMSWGPNMHTDMDEREMRSDADYDAVVGWLLD